MKMLVIFSATLLVAVTSALNYDIHSGFNWVNGKRNEYSDSMSWMMMTDESGINSMAILKTPDIKPRAIDLPNDVRFWLYTNSNVNSGYQLYVGDTANLNSSPFNSNNPTKIISHGFTNDISSPIIQDLKNAYLATGSYNVIGVDWGDLATAPLYEIAKVNTQPVGAYVGLMVDHLVSHGGSTYAKTHLIGHSLGAHVSGIAGDKASGTVARVTGLDTALPLFGDDANDIRLDAGDAAFVDSIHTCGGWLGFRAAVGHADYYPNGGVSVQPGCGADLTGSCSHSRSYEYFEETIRNKNIYPAHLCSSVDNAVDGNCNAGTSGVMGDGAASTSRGVFWLSTE